MDPRYLMHLRGWSGSINDSGDLPPLTPAGRRKAIHAVFGEPFLRYALAIPPENDLEQALEGSPPDVVNALSLAAHDYMRGRFGLSITDYDGLAGTFSHFDENAGTSIVNAMRLDCGGRLPEVPDTTDPVLAPLLGIARDLWPVMLLPPSRLPGWNQPHFALRCPLSDDAPQRGALVDAVMEDAHLSLLFSEAVAEQTIQEADYFVYRGKDARGGWASSSFDGYYASVDLSLFLSNVIKAAVINCGLDGAELEFGRIAASLELMLGRVRRLASGNGAVKMPAAVGFTGVQLESDDPVRMGSALLREPSPWERRWLFPGVDDLSMLLVGEVPVEWAPLDVAAFPPEPFIDGSGTAVPPPWPRARNLVNTRRHLAVLVDQVRLAVTLSSPPEAPLGVRQTGYGLWLDPAQSSPLVVSGGTVQLDASIRPGSAVGGSVSRAVPHDEFGGWWRMISERSEHFVSSIAVQRTLRALNERHDHADALIDIMIALESLIRGNQEISFKLAAYVAREVAPDDPVQRLTTFKTVKKLYSVRSGLVHGSSTKDDLGDTSADAAKLAVSVLRRLVAEDRNVPLSAADLDEFLLT